MNSLFILLGIESWKPVLTALLLPPVPLLLLVLLGARLILPRRGLGWTIIVVAVLGLWFSACTGVGQMLSRFVLHPPVALSQDRIKALKAQPAGSTAIIVLGGGLEPYAPEYGVSNLRYASLERLRYGVWLGRETGIPVGFSGGVGWAQPDSKPEARIAEQIAAGEFGRPLKWVEDDSRDTRENAARTVALLRKTSVRHIVLVTHGWHMPRAVANFVSAGGSEFRIDAAPMGLAHDVDLAVLAWIPTAQGLTDVRTVLRELVGRLAGA